MAQFAWSGLPVLLVILLSFAFGDAWAQSKAAPPAGMSQQQYDELVKSVGESVIQTLTARGLVTTPPPATTPAKPAETDFEALVADRTREALGRIPQMLAGYPMVWSDMAALPSRLNDSAAGGHGFWGYLVLLLVTGAAGLLAEAGIGRATFARRRALAEAYASKGGLWRVAAVAILDGLALLTLWLVVHLALGTLFAQAGAQTQVAGIVLRGLITWRMFRLLFRLYLRPGEAAIRIAPVNETVAHRISRLYLLAVIFAILARAWLALMTTSVAVDAVVLTNSISSLALLIFIVVLTRRDISSWLLGLIEEGRRESGVKATLAHHWHWLALPILAVLAGARAYDALSDRFEMPAGAISTLILLVGLLFAETLLSFLAGPPRTGGLAVGRRQSGRPLRFLVRATRATMWLAAVAVLVRTWAVDVLDLVDERTWSAFSGAWTTAVIAALVAYFAWEAVHFATERQGPRPLPGAVDDKLEKAPASISSSRLETLAPILRVVLGIVIFVTAALVILDSLSVSITPFLAGASVFGLAISFGSQTLVHDIVSGIFYLADDAFRVGEYIDCGKAKGTVEGFTLRSIRLRHQSGQIHTIPFGQLGQITNFSRDYSTLKFNLRFDRNIDLEKLRKVTKKIGETMLADPEFKDDFLEPLKLQGIADIADNAMVMRFKMTVRPSRPSYVQREAIKLLVSAFKEAGLEFAGTTAVVPTASGPTKDPELAAAAANASATKSS